MRPIRVSAVLSMLLVVACGTPQEQCISRGTRDLQILDRLIAESRATVSRGYAIEEVTTYIPVWRTCGYYRTGDKNSPVRPEMCLEDEPRISTRPKAIDLSAERQKLASMERKRQELDRQAAPVVAACRAQYPE